MAEPNYLNFADISHNAYQAGRQRARQEGIQNALQSYAEKPLEAENALVGYGDFDNANALRQRRMSDEATKRRAGYADTAKAKGYGAAREAAVMAGDDELATQYGKLDDAQRTRAKEALSLTARIGEQLKKTIPMGQDPNATIQQRRAQVLDLADDIKAMTGVDITPEQINSMDLSDRGIDSFIAQARALGAYDQPKLTEVSAGATLYDPTTREAVYTAPQADKWLAVPEGGMLVNTAAQGGQQGGMQSSQGVRGATGLPNMSGNMAEDFILTVAPGAQFTSGARTPEKNRQVGGQPNSMHLDDMARDFVPPAGVDRGALVQQLKASGNFTEVLDEGDHIHVGWREKGGAQPRQTGNRETIMGTPRLKTRPATAQEKAAYGIDPNIPAQIDERTGKLDIISGANSDQKERAALRKDAVNLRKEFDALPEVKQFNKVATQLGQVRQAASTPSAQNDIALIFSYMKMLDPDSVVREGEFATAQNAAGVPDQVRNLFNKAVSGQRLNDQQRKGIVQSAEGQYQAYADRYDAISQQYEGYEREFGLPDTTIQPRQRDGGQKPSGSTQGMTPDQMRTRDLYKGAKGQAGTRSNPRIPRNEAEYNGIRKGEFYIDTDGELVQK